MAELILFHHVLGLTEGVRDFAGRLQAEGHSVVVPDLFDGRTFDSITDGVAHTESVGFAEILSAAGDVAETRPEAKVYAGFSLGALAAHKLAQTRSGTKGALLYHHGDVPVDVFGASWPNGVDLQIHLSQDDEFREAGVAEAFIEAAAQSARASLFLYAGSEHLFTDSTLSGYDADATAQVVERSLELLDRIA